MSDPKFTQERTRFSSPWVADYLIRRPAGPAKRAFVLLHGYQQAGLAILKRLEAALPADAVIVAPNAPFPLPERQTDGSYRLGYSWYFYDPIADDYFIGPEIGAEFLLRLLEELNLSSLPMTLIGFSQGGYLSPFAAAQLPNVDHIIGIGCRFLIDEITGPVNARIDLLHGEDDEYLTPTQVRACHEELRAHGIPGGLFSFPKTPHRITPAIQAKVKELIQGFGE